MIFSGALIVIDGRHLLHSCNDWPKSATFQDICSGYVAFCCSQGSYVKVVFDGYGSTNSTNIAEQKRRSKGKASKTYLFDLGMSVQTS